MTDAAGRYCKIEIDVARLTFGDFVAGVVTDTTGMEGADDGRSRNRNLDASWRRVVVVVVVVEVLSWSL